MQEQARSPGRRGQSDHRLQHVPTLQGPSRAEDRAALRFRGCRGLQYGKSLIVFIYVYTSFVKSCIINPSKKETDIFFKIFFFQFSQLVQQ